MITITASESVLNYGSYTSSGVAFTEAKLAGHSVRLPKKNELLLDLDNPQAVKVFERHFIEFEEQYPAKYRLIPSKTAGHFHAIVTLQCDVTPMQRIFLQLYLGSHRMREFLSFQRILMGDKHPTLLIQPKEVKNG